MPRTLTAAKRVMTPQGLAQAAECLKILAHPQRLHLLSLLLRGRYTVGDLADACDLAQPTASEHLRLMQRCGFLHAEKKGRRTYYTVAESHLHQLMACIEARFGEPA